MRAMHRLCAASFRRVAAGAAAGIGAGALSVAWAAGAKTHTISVGGVRRDLPIREVGPGFRVALFSILGDHALTEACGKELAKKIPKGTDVLLMPDGKAVALLHVMGRESGLPCVVPRKEKASYMSEPVLKVIRSFSMTTQVEKAFFLGEEDVVKLRGKRVVFADDVVSSGGSLVAIRELISKAGGIDAGVMCIFTEGGPRKEHDGVICLGNLPLNHPSWA